MKSTLQLCLEVSGRAAAFSAFSRTEDLDADTRAYYQCTSRELYDYAATLRGCYQCDLVAERIAEEDRTWSARPYDGGLPGNMFTGLRAWDQSDGVICPVHMDDATLCGCCV